MTSSRTGLWITIIIAAMTISATALAQAEQPKVFIYPFETVNVPPELGDAAAEVFAAAMMKESFAVIDWRPTAEAMRARKKADSVPLVVAPATAAPMESETTPAAETASPEGNSEAAAKSNQEGGAEAVTEASEAKMPTPETSTASAPDEAQPISENSAAQKLDSDPVSDELTATDKYVIAREAGIDFYVEGKIVRLGSKSMVVITMKSIDGVTMAQKNMNAADDNDLHLVLTRIAKAFKDDVSPEQTKTLNNATREESTWTPNRAIVQNYNGFLLGGGAVLSSDTDYGFIAAGYQGIWEIRRMRMGLNIGLNFASETNRFAANGGLFATWYLVEKNISPYLGGGIGLFLGDRVGETDNYEGDNGAIGFEAMPAFGVEFTRDTKMRFFVEFRYLFLIRGDGSFGHGPMAGVGLAFY